jgi:serine/threonine protein phosphatase 1
MNEASDDQMSQEHGEQTATATYAIGDLHGEVTLLKQLLEQLAPRAEDTLILRLSRSRRGCARYHRDVGQACAVLHCIFLRGNHDEAWLETWNGSAFTRCPHIPGAGLTHEKLLEIG